MRKKNVNEDINNQDLQNKLFNRALFFLKFRLRSEKEVETYLLSYLQKNRQLISSSSECVTQILNRLKDLRFIDDNNFAKLWIENRMLLKPKGKKVIAYELKQKGISQEIIDEALVKMQKDYPEKQLIKVLLLKKEKQYSALGYQEKKQKLLSFALRRGFNYSDIEDIVDEIVKKQ